MSFAKGDRVLIQGLSAAPQHNGKTGTVLSFVAAKERYHISLDGAEPNAKPLGLKPTNLTLCSDKELSKAKQASRCV